MTLRLVPDVPAPPGAIHVYDWDQDGPHTPVWRSFDLDSWDVDGDHVAVDLSGKQNADGSVKLEVLVHFTGGALAPGEARRLGTALLKAANAADQWTRANATH